MELGKALMNSRTKKRHQRVARLENMSTSNTTMKSTDEQRRRAKNESKKLRDELMNKGEKTKSPKPKL